MRHVNGLLQFYLDTRNETSVTLTGETSLVLPHDYLESLTERGRAAPSAGKHAIDARPEALGIDWPLTNPLVLSAAIVESNEEPKHAPPWNSKRPRQSNTYPQMQRYASANGHLRTESSSLHMPVLGSPMYNGYGHSDRAKIPYAALYLSQNQETSRPELADGLPADGAYWRDRLDTTNTEHKGRIQESTRARHVLYFPTTRPIVAPCRRWACALQPNTTQTGNIAQWHRGFQR